MPKRNYITRAMLEAQCEALHAKCEGLTIENVRLRRKVNDLQVAALNQVRDMSRITTMQATLARCKELSAQGVPCYVRRGYIIHSKTGAILT